MSAYIVSKAHIDALVSAAATTANADHGDAGLSWYHEGETCSLGYNDVFMGSQIGQMLWAENLASIHARYPDTLESDSNYPGPADFDSSSVANYQFSNAQPLAPVVILKALNCYEYQSCEHAGWATSEAFAFCEALRGKMIRKLDGYNDAPWEIREEMVSQ
jgi:hypothetical protein